MYELLKTHKNFRRRTGGSFALFQHVPTSSEFAKFDSVNRPSLPPPLRVQDKTLYAKCSFLPRSSLISHSLCILQPDLTQLARGEQK